MPQASMVQWGRVMRCLCCAGGMWGATLLAAGGATTALPRGGLDTSKSSARTPEKTGEATDTSKDGKVRSCFADMMNPPGSSGSFTPDNSFLYLLANSGKPTPIKADAIPKQTLYKINLTTLQAEALLSLGMRQDPALVTYGEPPQGMTAVLHLPGKSGRNPGCYEGPAGIVSIAFAKEGVKAVRAKGEFEMTRTPNGFLLVDGKKDSILQVDPASFQTRNMRKLPVGQRSLFFDPAKNQLITLATGAREVLAYGENKDKIERQLKLKPGDRIIQNGSSIVIVHLEAATNGMTLLEVPGWNGGAKPGSFTVTLPLSFPVASAGAEAHVEKRRLLVYGASDATKRQWQKLFIFDYGRGKLLNTVAAGAKEFIGFAEFTPKGDKAVIEWRDLATRQTTAVKVYDFAKGELQVVTLPLPPKAS